MSINIKIKGQSDNDEYKAGHKLKVRLKMDLKRVEERHLLQLK